MRLVFMGPPGAGKGTQGELLAQYMGIPRLSTGEMLREARANRTELGRRAQAYMDSGDLVPDEVVLGLVAEALDSTRAQEGFILDGFPRTIAQAEGLNEILDARSTPLDGVILLEVPEEELVRRLTGRSADESRTDDDPETVRRRLQVYQAETEPVIRWYAEQGVRLIAADGVGSIDDIQSGLRGLLDS
ncbi:MAG: adenylate kinase [Gemmatimonadales bacterium]|jgi:adenylate kinase